MPLVRFEQVTKRFAGGSEALRGVTLSVERGEFLAITGPSGAGKSTLLKLIAGLERPTSGAVYVGEENVSRMPARALPYLRRKLGIILQEQRLLFDRNALENVMLPLRVAGYTTHEAGRRARAALDKVGLLDRANANPITLSGGEQQRVAIARAVVNRPVLLLADEPTGHLDAKQSLEIGEVFRAFNQVGVTVVVATHDTALARQVATRAVAVRDGRLAE